MSTSGRNPGGIRLLPRNARLAAAALGVMLLHTACEPQNINNSQDNQQNTAEAAAKVRSLQPAVGAFCGSMHMIASDEDFDANLSLQVVQDNIHSSTSEDPTDTVQVPKLAGSLTFPAVANLGDSAYTSIPDLMQATGGSNTISFTYGDYNTLNQTINLPFTVANFPSGDFGSVTGTLTGDAFAGSWYSDSSKLVGTFSFTRCTGPGSSS